LRSDHDEMQERFAVAFRDGSAGAAGALQIEQDRLLLRGRGEDGSLELEIPYSDLAEIRVGRRRSERLNGYATLVLERIALPPVQVAPLGVALLHEIADLLSSLSNRAGGDLLIVSVPLKPGCLARARELLAKGPPLDPASLGLSTHEVYLREGEAIFVFRGNRVREQVGKAMSHPAIWRAGLAWHRCFSAPPRIVERAEVSLDAELAYRRVAADHEVRA
jgi:hypothetical protein